MTKDKILELAHDAGLAEVISLSEFRLLALERFADLVAAHEREQCAKVCENLYYGLRIQPTRSECADAIRSRK